MMAHKNTATIADISEAQDEIMRKLKPPLQLLTTETVLGNPIKNPTPKKYDLSTFSRRKLINWACYRVPMKVVEGIIVPYPFLEAIFHSVTAAGKALIGAAIARPSCITQERRPHSKVKAEKKHV